MHEMPTVSPEEFARMKAAYSERPDEQIREMLLAITPLVRVYHRLFALQKPFDARSISYCGWQPDMDAPVTQELRMLGEICTLHLPRGGFFANFKPTVGEVLDAIPDDLIGRVAAFELFGPKTPADFHRQQKPMLEGYQIGVARLY